MRQLVLAAFAISISFASFEAYAAQATSCSNNVSRIGFTDTIEGGQPFELWKCQDQWHLSNLGNIQVTMKEVKKDEFRPCATNSSTGEEFCCPQVNLDGKTKTEAPKESSMAAKFHCVTEAGQTSQDPNDKIDLLIEPASNGTNRSSTIYRIHGENNNNDAQNAQGKKTKTRGMKISVEKPTGSGDQKEGSITVQTDVGTPSTPKTNKGGPKNPCNKDETLSGSFCQLPANILGHSYNLDQETKGAVKDERQEGQKQNVQSDGTGRKAFSEGGGAVQ